MASEIPTENSVGDIEKLFYQIRDGILTPLYVQGGFNQYIIVDGETKSVYLFEYDQDACFLSRFEVQGHNLTLTGHVTEPHAVIPLAISLKGLRDAILFASLRNPN